MAARYGRFGTWVRPGARSTPLAAILLAPLLFFAAEAAARADDAGPLRLCADPANLPFSSNDAGNPGIYVEVGAIVAKAMGRDMTPVWSYSYFGKRNIRTTLLAGQCDVAVGLPDDNDFMGPRIIFSKPLLQIGYGVVSRDGNAIKSLEDLKGLRVGVQFESSPQNYLATRDDVEAVTFKEPDAAMQALAAGKIDAAFIWAPVAGYMNKTVYGGAYKIAPVAGAGMQWQAAVGFSSKNTALRDQVDAALAGKTDEIKALLVKYGFPTDAPIVMGSADASPKAVAIAQSSGGAADQPPAQPTAEPAPAKAAIVVGNVEQGHELFNGTCAHCHGPDAVQSERRIDLRLLHHRYGDDMDKTFMTTVTQGRPAKGMPNWSGIFTDEQFSDVLAFLHTVQTADP